MNNGPLLFLGIFFTVAFSWTGIILTNLVQQQESGADQPYYDTETDTLTPTPPPGLARQGSRVYQDLGCLYCHSQQVRHPLGGTPGEASPDVARGWGERPSVARDYVHDDRVMLGTMRTGPDLRNVGVSKPDPMWHYLHLYNPQITSAGSIMPPFRFLFEVRELNGRPSSPRALTGMGDYGPPAGFEVVPTARAEALVAYLQSLRTAEASLPETTGGTP